MLHGASFLSPCGLHTNANNQLSFQSEQTDDVQRAATWLYYSLLQHDLSSTNESMTKYKCISSGL